MFQIIVRFGLESDLTQYRYSSINHNFNHSRMNILPNGYDYRGNLFSQISFFWIDKLIWKGLRKALKQEDLYPCPREQCSEYLYDKFEKNWKMELSDKNRKPDVKIALAKTVKSQFIINRIFFLLDSLFIDCILAIYETVSSLYRVNCNLVYKQ